MGSIIWCLMLLKILINFCFDCLLVENIWFVIVDNFFGYEGFVFDYGDFDKNIDCINNIVVLFFWWVWLMKVFCF